MVKDFEQMLVRIDENFPRGESRILGELSFRELFYFKWQYIRHFESFTRLEVFPLLTGIQFLNI